MKVHIELPESDVAVIISKAVGEIISTNGDFSLTQLEDGSWRISKEIKSFSMPGFNQSNQKVGQQINIGRAHGVSITQSKGSIVSQTIIGDGNISVGVGNIEIKKRGSYTIRIGAPSSVILKGSCRYLNLVKDSRVKVGLGISTEEEPTITEI